MVQRHLLVRRFAERGTFINGPNKPPLAVGLAFTTPILLFLVTERTLPGWRARVTSVSPVLLISVNNANVVNNAVVTLSCGCDKRGLPSWNAKTSAHAEVLVVTAFGIGAYWR